jgi:histidine triad (HIT) family protein
MADCVFCAILEGRAPGSVIYEDEDAVVFLDLFPVHPGHALVVPRRHVEDLDSCPGELAGRLFEVSARVAPAIVRATDAAGFNVWTANGEAAGQEVFHLHLHVLPRYEDDTFGLRFPKGYPQEAERAALDAMADRIRSTLRR